MGNGMDEVVGGDGRPLAKGEVVYGISDGREWRIGKILPNRRYQVVAAGSDKGLRAEWLTHERPVDVS